MSRREFSLAAAMSSIMLLAADFAAFRFLAWPALDFTPLHLTLSLLPMLNVLAILGYRFVRIPGSGHPFARGVFVFGLVAMLTHVSCLMLYPEQLKATYIAPIGPSFQLCKAYRVPYYVGESVEGYSYFRYYPALVLFNFVVPQFLAAGLGGLGYVVAASLARKRASQFRGDS